MCSFCSRCNSTDPILSDCVGQLLSPGLCRNRCSDSTMVSGSTDHANASKGRVTTLTLASCSSSSLFPSAQGCGNSTPVAGPPATAQGKPTAADPAASPDTTAAGASTKPAESTTSGGRGASKDPKQLDGETVPSKDGTTKDDASKDDAAAAKGGAAKDKESLYSPLEVERPTHTAGTALGHLSTAVGIGSTIASNAHSSLKDASASATFQGHDGSTAASSAKSMLDSLSVLKDHSDAKKVLGATWVVLSESAKFFTIGKVVIAVLQQIYSMWNSWDAKTLWVGEFIAFLKVVEEDLTAGLAVFEHLAFLRGLEKQLESARELVRKITGRARCASFVYALYDERALAEQHVLIEARKSECLFGHATDIKALSASNRSLMDQVAVRVRERQERLESYKLLGGDAGSRARKLQELEQAFAPMDCSDEIKNCIDTFVRQQRGHLVARWIFEAGGKDSSTVAAVVDHDATPLATTDASQKCSAYIARHLSAFQIDLELEDRTLLARDDAAAADVVAEAAQFAEQSARQFAALPDAEIAALPSEEDRVTARAENARKAKITLDQRAAKVDQDRRSLVRELKADLDQSMQQATEHERSARFTEAITTLQNAITVLVGLRASTLPVKDREQTPEQCEVAQLCDAQRLEISAVHRRIRSAQIAAGLLLPLHPSLALVLRFTPVSPSERALYTRVFLAAYAADLAKVSWWLRLGDAALAKWQPGWPSRGKILAVRAPPPPPTQAATTDAEEGAEEVDAAASSSAASAAMSREASGMQGCVTTSIFLSFLSEHAPHAVRAMHIVPDRAARLRHREARATRKAARATARLEAARAALARHKQERPARNATRHQRAEAGGMEETDSETDNEKDREHTQSVLDRASKPESAEETAAFESSSDDAYARGDLRRIFPSLSFQFAACAPSYQSNLLRKGAMLTRRYLHDLNAVDFVADIIVAPAFAAKKDKGAGNAGSPPESKDQENPNLALAAAAAGSAASSSSSSSPAVVDKACIVLDGAAWSVSDDSRIGVDALEAGPPARDFEDSLLAALGERSSLAHAPDWLGVVLSIPFQTRFDTRVLNAGPHKICSLDLHTHALSDLSEYTKREVEAEENSEHASSSSTSSDDAAAASSATAVTVP